MPRHDRSVLMLPGNLLREPGPRGPFGLPAQGRPDAFGLSRPVPLPLRHHYNTKRVRAGRRAFGTKMGE
ncbi:hypothetical protein AGMMS4952_01830 [Spirochaetia bacterium]|nr:hypothetical protein AGMMS4952_01830 [Spirochaetia bacterium]